MRNDGGEHVGDQPVLWCRPWWTRPGPLAAAWACAIVYGALIPFDFDQSLLRASADGGITLIWAWATGPRWVFGSDTRSSLGLSVAVSDVLVNLILYAPLGAMLRLAVAQRVRSAWQQIGLVAVSVAGMSWSIECMQGLLATRYASIVDFIANTASATLCAAAAPLLRETLWRWTFHLHRRTAHFTLPMFDRLRDVRHQARGTRGTVGVAAGLLLIGAAGACLPMLEGRSVQPPFMTAFMLPYDVAVVRLTARIALYAVLALGLSLWLVRRTPDRWARAGSPKASSNSPACCRH